MNPVDLDMFERVMDWLESDGDDHDDGFTDNDIRVSIAALFYHMIAVDGVISAAESERLRSLLENRFSLTRDQIAVLASAGEDSDKASAGLFSFAVILTRELNTEQRQQILVQLTDLAKADGVIHPLEQEMLAHVEVLLKLKS